MRRQAFTLIELLVVISIIALLAGILLPALGAAWRSGQSTQSLSNLRQWGLGTHAYLVESRDRLPWEGRDIAAATGDAEGIGSVSTIEAIQSFNNRSWWANVIPRYVGQQGYRELMVERLTAGRNVPLPGEESIFLDPLAQPPANVPYRTSGAIPLTLPSGTISLQAQYYFNYVWNSKLNRDDVAPLSRMGEITKPSATVLMLEIRAHRNEFPASSSSVNRARADWKRFAKRHHGAEGGHILFADGHANFVKHAYAHTPGNDTIAGGLGYNKPDLIWTPRGRAE